MSSISPEAIYRRIYPRRKFRRSIGILFRGSYEIGGAEEIGEGGISFFHSSQMAVGDSIVVSFQIPLAPFICVHAEIRNQRISADGKILYGCSFGILSFENKREIRNFVNARLDSEQ